VPLGPLFFVCEKLQTRFFFLQRLQLDPPSDTHRTFVRAHSSHAKRVLQTFGDSLLLCEEASSCANEEVEAGTERLNVSSFNLVGALIFVRTEEGGSGREEVCKSSFCFKPTHFLDSTVWVVGCLE
jgi:hypothetical protein